VGSVRETRQAENEVRSVAARPAATVGARDLGSEPGPAKALALQSAIGNASVARLARSGRLGEAGAQVPAAPLTASAQAQLDGGGGALREAVLARRGEDGESAAPPRIAPARPPTPRRVLARGFWGKVWGGIKSVGSAVGGAVKDAAVAVGGAVKTAAVAVGGAVKSVAESVWDGAKAAGQWAVDWLSKAGSAVWDALKWFGAGAWTIIKEIGTYLWEKLSLLGSLCWDFIRFFPFRLWRLIVEAWDVIPGLIGWLWKGVRQGASWEWVWSGFKQGLNWSIETAIQMLELFGVADALQFVWGLIFHTRPLTDGERTASETVHGTGLVPYREVRVDEGSFMVKLGKWINKIKDPNASERAVTTMHIIQAPKGIDLETTVHELTHVVQYEKTGAVYMPQALHGQASEMGYDYGDLARARTEGKHYKDFNREQQAQIAEDYYVVKTTGTPGRYNGSEADLQPFVDEMRKGEF